MTSISSGSLSSALLQQMQQARLAMFQKADTDESGGLSLEEFKAAGPKDEQGNAIAPPSGAPSVEDIFASLDSDGDGSLTQSEMDAGFGQKTGQNNQQSLLSSDMMTHLLSQLSDEETQSIFSTADQDGDGSLTQEEFDAAVETIVTSALEEMPAGGPPPGGAKGGSEEEETSSSQVYDALDTNQDGTVSLEELLAANDDDDENGFSFQAMKADFMKFLLSLQEQQSAA